MGFIMFAIMIGSLIISEIRNTIVMKTVDNVSEETGDDYFDDFETW